MEGFKHKCGYGIVDIQPDCNCYEEFMSEKRTQEVAKELFIRLRILSELELSLKPKYANDIFTWKQIEDAVKGV